MTKEEAKKIKPFDIVVYTNHDGKRIDVLVKRVSEIGVFGLDKIQSTACLYYFKDIEIL
jgi:hypothetical protein